MLLALACVEEDFADGQFLCSPTGGADECPPGMSCGKDGLCRTPAKPSDAQCTPRSCESVSPLCGTLDDGCGGTLACGCWSPYTCGGAGVPGQCGCLPEQTLERSAGAFWSDATIGSVAWTDPANARLSDAAHAVAELGEGDVSHYLKAADFGFELPEGAVVLGVEIVIERSSSDAASTLEDHEVRLAVDGVLAPKIAAESDAWSETETDFAYGGAGDLWDLPEIARQLVNQPNFGMALAVTSSKGSASARVDAIRIKVHVANPTCPDAGSR